MTIARSPDHAAAAWPATTLAEQYQRVRAASIALARPLTDEDCQVQSMPDASPTCVSPLESSDRLADV